MPVTAQVNIDRAKRAAITLVLLACGGGADSSGTPQPPAPAPVASVSVSPASGQLTVGQTLQLSATTSDASGAVLTGRTITWNSTDVSHARVSTSGVVTAVAAGSATITATSEGISGSAAMTVSVVHVATVSVSPTSGAIFVNHALPLAATLRDAGGAVITAGQTIAWSSSNESAAVVSTTGVVTALAVGTATITATSDGKSGSAAVSIAALPSAVTISDWTPIGPQRVPIQFGHIGSGKTQAFAIFDANTMYAGGGLGSGIQGPYAWSGAFKTTNGGAQWTPVNNGLTDPMVNTMWVDATNANIVLAGTETGGIFRSSDGAQSWTRIGTYGATSEFVTVGTDVYAATASGILRSTDRGATWTVAQATAATVRSLAAAGGAMIAGLSNGAVLMQATAGAAWVTVSTNARLIQSVAIDAATPTTAYAVVSCCPTSLLGSANGWAAITTPLNEVHAIAVTPATHVLYAASGGAIYNSANGGTTWTRVSNVTWDNRRIVTTPTAVFFGTDQGLYRTTDAGNTWTDLSGGAQSWLLSSISVRGSTVITGVQDYPPTISYDAGATWVQPQWTQSNPGGEDGQVLINPGNATHCYAYTLAAYQYSSDGCHTFRSMTGGILASGAYPQGAAMSSIAVDPTSPNVVYVVSSTGVYRSTDFGATMSATGWPLANPTAIAASSDGHTIFVGTTTGLSRSTNGGTTWTNISTAPVPSTLHPTAIAVDSENPRVVLVGMSRGTTYGGGVLRSTDGGATFALVNTGIPSDNGAAFGVDIMAIRFSNSGVAAMATWSGVYVSMDFGDHWQSIRGTAVPTYFGDVAWDGNTLYTATWGQGALRATVTPPVAAGVVR